MTQAPNLDWLNAFVQLGKAEGEGLAPLGSGFLLLDDNRPWLITSRTTLETAQGDDLLAWVGSPGTVVGISQALALNELQWVVHEQHNLAACLFPLDPAWNVKAFSQAACVPGEKLMPLMDACSLGSPYGFDLGGRPPVMALDGVLSSVDLERGRLFTTAPLLPMNTGAPLLVLTAPLAMGGSVLLAGVMAQTLPVRRPVEGAMVPPHLVPTQLHLSLAHPVGAVFDLVRSEGAKAQLARVEERVAEKAGASS
jgi:hypothetical protein